MTRSDSVLLSLSAMTTGSTICIVCIIHSTKNHIFGMRQHSIPFWPVWPVWRSLTDHHIFMGPAPPLTKFATKISQFLLHIYIVCNCMYIQYVTVQNIHKTTYKHFVCNVMYKYVCTYIRVLTCKFTQYNARGGGRGDEKKQSTQSHMYARLSLHRFIMTVIKKI